MHALRCFCSATLFVCGAFEVCYIFSYVIYLVICVFDTDHLCEGFLLLVSVVH